MTATHFAGMTRDGAAECSVRDLVATRSGDAGFVGALRFSPWQRIAAATAEMPISP